MKIANYVLFFAGVRLFKGLHLLFLQYVPGGTFIQGATSIPESRVYRWRDMETARRTETHRDSSTLRNVNNDTRHQN